VVFSVSQVQLSTHNSILPISDRFELKYTSEQHFHFFLAKN